MTFRLLTKSDRLSARTIPTGAVQVRADGCPDSVAVAYTYTNAGRACWIGYRGTAGRATVNYYSKQAEEAARAWLLAQAARKEATKAAKAERGPSSVAVHAKALREELAAAGIKASVVSSNYSMGCSITVRVISGAVKVAEAIAERHESISRDEMTGEILSGGNRYVDVSADSDRVKAAQATLQAAVEAAAAKVEGHTLEEIAGVSGARIARASDGRWSLWTRENEGDSYRPRECWDLDGVAYTLASWLADRNLDLAPAPVVAAPAPAPVQETIDAAETAAAVAALPEVDRAPAIAADTQAVSDRIDTTMAPSLAWKPEPGRQTVQLRAAGLSVADLRAAGFMWTRAQQWEAESTDEARRVHALLTGAPAPQPPKGPSDTDHPATVTPAPVAAAPARKADTRLAALCAKATAFADRMTAKAEAMRAPGRMENTQKRLAQAMHRRLDADRLDRGADLLRAWAANPAGCPEWSPTEATAIGVRSREVDSVNNGYHSYHVETDRPRASADPLTLKLRAAYPENGGGGSRVDIGAMEARLRFREIPGFFATPPSLARDLIAAADIQPGMLVLEPSAGKGDLADLAVSAGAGVECFEINGDLRDVLRAKGFTDIGCDFMGATAVQKYDRVVMNPPFERGAEMAHVIKAFDMLKPGGRLAAIMSAGPWQREGGADRVFREWAAKVGAVVEPNAAGAFAGADAFRQTGVATVTVIIDKREA